MRISSHTQQVSALFVVQQFSALPRKYCAISIFKVLIFVFSIFVCDGSCGITTNAPGS